MTPKEKNAALDLFQEQFGYTFQRSDLLERALVHRSILNEAPERYHESNERLEFLGDAVMQLISSDALFRLFPSDPEGELSRKRALAVCEESFAAFGRSIGLPEILELGHGEEMSGGREKPSLIADAFEAVCGAVYLDGGYDFLKQWFEERVHQMIPRLNASQSDTDAKSRLQSVLGKQGKAFRYLLLDEKGPDHAPVFTVALEIDGRIAAKGRGSSKKKAEAQAAANALNEMEMI